MENSEKKTVSRKVIDREVIMRKYHVHIKNFRNLKDVKVTLSPLTILTGENGSGKSTLFKALLFLKHNHDHEAAKKLKYVIDDDINLGGWEHIANDPKKPISIKITEETWGYDHEVEEIYDIDNCPFELNPTEEYAEIVWKDSVSRNPGFPKEKKKYKLNRSFKRCNILSSKRTTKEYIYSENRLRNISVELEREKISFKFGYLYFTESKTGEFVVSTDDISASPYALGMMLLNTKYDNSFDLSETLSTLASLVRSSISITYNPLSSPFSLEKGKSFGVFYSDILSENNILFNEPALLAWRLAGGDISKFWVLNDIFASIFQFRLLFDEPFKSSEMIDTVRTIPKKVYLKEDINEKTYYGILKRMLVGEEDLNEDDKLCLRLSQRRINYWLKQLEIGENLGHIETEDVIKFFLKQLDSRRVPLDEISSGALQILPVIYHLCIFEKAKVNFFIQQPELHLHPRLQSKIIELFLDSLNPSVDGTEYVVIYDRQKDLCSISQLMSGNAGSDYNYNNSLNEKGVFIINFDPIKMLVVETHSEHLLKKLQVLVSQGKTLQLWPEGYCSGEDVKLKDALSIYYLAKDKNGNTKAIEMELDDNGFFKTETPKGFFDESLELNRQLLLGRN